MDVQCSGGENRTAFHARAHGVVHVFLNARDAQRILHGSLGDESAGGGDGVAADAVGIRPCGVHRFALASGAKGGVALPAQRPPDAGRVPASIEGQIHPVILPGALAPPEEARGVADHAGALAQLDQFELGVHVVAGEQKRFGKIDGERCGGVVGKDHRCRNVVKACAARAGEAQDPRDDVRWAGGNICHRHFARSGRSPGRT